MWRVGVGVGVGEESGGRAWGGGHGRCWWRRWVDWGRRGGGCGCGEWVWVCLCVERGVVGQGGKGGHRRLWWRRWVDVCACGRRGWGGGGKDTVCGV